MSSYFSVILLTLLRLFRKIHCYTPIKIEAIVQITTFVLLKVMSKVQSLRKSQFCLMTIGKDCS